MRETKRIYRDMSSFDPRKNKLDLYWPLRDGTRGLA